MCQHTHTRGKAGREKGKKTRLLPHKRLFVWASASSPKLDDSVFDGTRCTTIKETEELTAGQIRALNLSICLGAVHRAGQESRASCGDYGGEISARRTGCLYEVGRQRGRQTTEIHGERCSIHWGEGAGEQIGDESQQLLIYSFLYSCVFPLCFVLMHTKPFGPVGQPANPPLLTKGPLAQAFAEVNINVHVPIVVCPIHSNSKLLRSALLSHNHQSYWQSERVQSCISPKCNANITRCQDVKGHHYLKRLFRLESWSLSKTFCFVSSVSCDLHLAWRYICIRDFTRKKSMF